MGWKFAIAEYLVLDVDNKITKCAVIFIIKNHSRIVISDRVTLDSPGSTFSV